MIGATELFAIAFGLWAGVIGLSVRLVLSRLADLDDRIGEMEKEIIRFEHRCK